MVEQQPPEDKTTFVVYEYTRNAGGMVGNRYMTMYDEQIFKETFESSDGVTSSDGREKVIAKGVDFSRAQELCGQVPIITQLRGAEQAATRSDGTLNQRMLEMEMANVLFCADPQRKV